MKAKTKRTKKTTKRTATAKTTSPAGPVAPAAVKLAGPALVEALSDLASKVAAARSNGPLTPQLRRLARELRQHARKPFGPRG